MLKSLNHYLSMVWRIDAITVLLPEFNIPFETNYKLEARRKFA